MAASGCARSGRGRCPRSSDNCNSTCISTVTIRRAPPGFLPGTTAREWRDLPRWNRLLADTGPLRESPAFRRLWAGTTLSSVGGALTGFAVILQVYDLTKSPFAVQAFAGLRLVWLLYALVAAQSALGAVDRPARSTFIPSLLPASQLPA